MLYFSFSLSLILLHSCFTSSSLSSFFFLSPRPSHFSAPKSSSCSLFLSLPPKERNGAKARSTAPIRRAGSPQVRVEIIKRRKGKEGGGGGRRREGERIDWGEKYFSSSPFSPLLTHIISSLSLYLSLPPPPSPSLSFSPLQVMWRFLPANTSASACSKNGYPGHSR